MVCLIFANDVSGREPKRQSAECDRSVRDWEEMTASFFSFFLNKSLLFSLSILFVRQMPLIWLIFS